MKSFVDLPNGSYRGRVKKEPVAAVGGMFCRFTVDIVGEGEIHFSTHYQKLRDEGWRGLRLDSVFNVHLGPVREVKTHRGNNHKLRRVRVTALPQEVQPC